MRENKLISTFFIALLLLIAWQVLRILSPFFHPIFWGALLAYTCYPLYERLKRKVSANVAALLITLGVLFVVAPIFLAATVRLTLEVTNFIQAVMDFVRQGRLEEWTARIAASEWMTRLKMQASVLEGFERTLSAWLLESARNLGNFTVGQAGRFTKNFVLFHIGAVLSLVLLFVFLKDGRKVYKFLYSITPLDEKGRRAVFGRIEETFSAVIRGQILSAFTQGVVAGIIFMTLGLPVPILGAALTFLGALIPYLGAASVWLPYTIYLVIQGAFIKAGVLFLIGVFVISLMDNFLKPALIGKKAKLPYLLLFLVILGGLSVYGLSGVFLGPVFAAVFFALVDVYREKYLN